MSKHLSIMNSGLNPYQANAIQGEYNNRQRVTLGSSNNDLPTAVAIEENGVIVTADASNRTVKPAFTASGAGATEPGDTVQIFNAQVNNVVVHPPAATGHIIGNSSSQSNTINIGINQMLVLTYQGFWNNVHRWSAILHGSA